MGCYSWVRRTGLGDVGGIDDGNGLGVFVLEVVLFSVDLFMFLEVLGPFEGLVADLRGVSEGGGGEGEGITSHIWGLRGVCTGRGE